MTRFVEFTARGGKKIWLNPDCCVSLMDAPMNGEQCVSVIGADGEIPYYVIGTVPEVMAKLQGEQPQPAPAADDIAGWWVGPKAEVYYVIGKDHWGRVVYQIDGFHHLHMLPPSMLATWTRDPNRKGWDE